MPSQEELQAMEQARSQAADAVVDSPASKRLIVSGPGTGKSYAFKRSLAKVIEQAGEGQGLALTFVKNLVSGLEKDLGALARVDTFHGYSKQLMHQHVAGLQKADLYPLLLELIVDDLAIASGRSTTKREIERHLQTLDFSDDLIAAFMEAADYYNAVSFPDLVFRVFEHFRENEDVIPEWPLIVVDEYQDFSRLETKFIDLLAKKSPVLIAGDDDQALYGGFRYASPEFIRELANRGDYERYGLPFCSRCTAAVVAAVNDVIEVATRKGYLKDRLDKDFHCYLPSKEGDSAANPKLIHVECSTFLMPYAGQYIVQQIKRIPGEDVAESLKAKEPTALVIGPNPFLTAAFKVVSEQFPQARMKVSERFVIDALDGYARIAEDEGTRLGWRILTSCEPPANSKDIIKAALDGQSELVDLLPSDYVARHREIALLVGILIDEGALSPGDEKTLCAALGRSIESVREHLKLTSEATDDEREIEVSASQTDEQPEAEKPEILFTTPMGAKGLSAQHVFIVGLNNGHFPKSSPVTDEEICTFLVALSRTRKRCHLVSYKFFVTSGLQKCEFLAWIKPHIDLVKVNKDYDFTPERRFPVTPGEVGCLGNTVVRTRPK